MKFVAALSALLFLSTGFLLWEDHTAPAFGYKEKLSDYELFTGELRLLQPATGVMPYELTSPLFSDYASKARFIKLPAGSSLAYQDREVLDFPEGTIIAKTFYYPNDARHPEKGNTLLETRILLRESGGWKAYPYVWETDQSEAYLDVAGSRIDVQWRDEKGKKKKLAYSVPNMNQCKGCHSYKNEIRPIGPTVWQLNRTYPYAGGEKNQLVKWKEMKILNTLPDLEKVPSIADWNDPSTGTLAERARAYLDINCAHCHNEYGPANTSGLFLDIHENNPEAWGVNKAPIAAGRGSGGLKFGIAPGKPGESILLYRMDSDDSGVMMPELGRRLIHEEGVELIRAWIAGM